VPASRIKLVRNPLPDDKMLHVSREKARTQLGLPDAKIITYVGHYNHIKGVDILVKAFREIAARDENVFLVTAWSGIGNCPQMDALRNDAEFGKRVISLGRVPVPELLAASNVVGLPYRLTMGQAVYPAVLLEAIAANVPTVTSDLPLLRELTQGGKTAQLVPPENADALANALVKILNEPALAQTMRTAQREWMLHNRPQSIAKEYERVYAELTAPETEILQPAHHRADV
jgi:glycosyltransferase involved in cell wall biosynthesis